MKLVERSYSTKLFRPKPVTFLSEDECTAIVAFSWTNQSHANKVIEEVSKYLEAAIADVEVTSPFEIHPGLSKTANNLRVATFIANEVLLRTENKAEYSAAVEVVVVHKNNGSLSYAQVGQPQLYLKKEQQSLQPMSAGVDFRSPPLPQNLIGIDSTLLVRSGTIRYSEGDHLIFLASSLVSPTFLDYSGSPDIVKLTEKMSQVYPENPFWLGILEL